MSRRGKGEGDACQRAKRWERKDLLLDFAVEVIILINECQCFYNCQNVVIGNRKV